MRVNEILARISGLKPMPAVAMRLLEAAQDPNADLGKVVSWIEKDPAITTNLLKLCNSPFYGVRREVTSVRQAASLLGMKQVVQLAFTVLASRYLSSAQPGYALGAGELWRASIATAIAAETIAQEVRYPNPSTAYTAGLLQDLGKVVVAEFLEGELSQIWGLIDQGECQSFEEAEQRVVGMTHPEVGAILLERWGFPPSLVEAIRTHHRPAQAVLDPALSRICHLADAFAMTLGMGLGADGLAYVLDGEALSSLGLTDSQRVDALLESVGRKFQAAEAMLASSAETR